MQDCGTPAAFALTGRINTLPRSTDVESPEELDRLRAQPSCSDRVDRRVDQATWAGGLFFGLAAVGAALGLIDDRLQLRAAPRFEDLLRERPVDAPGDVWDQPVVPDEDIGKQLPDVEGSDVESVVVWSVVAVCVLLLAGGASAVLREFGGVQPFLLLVAVLGAVAARALASADLMVLERGLLERGATFVRALEVMVACDWAGRVRPAFGSAGVESHALVRRGVDRARVLVDVGLEFAVAAAAHAGLVAVLAFWTLVVGWGDPTFPPYGFVLVLVCIALFVAGVAVAPARFRRLPCELGRTTLRRFAQRWEQAPSDVVWMVALAFALPVVHGVVVVAAVAAFGGDVTFFGMMLVVALALAFGALAPVPDGLVAADAFMVLGLCAVGVDAVVAVAAVLLWRILMTWLPMIPGYVLTRRLIDRGTF